MIRKQVYIEAGQEEKLKRLSHRLGITEAELIRRAIDSFEAPARVRPEASSALVQLLEQRAQRQPAGGQTDTWAREAIYEERLARLSPR